MSLDSFIADIHAQLHDLCTWQDPQARLRSEANRLRGTLDRCSDGLERLQKTIDELQTRLADKETRAARLAERVGIFHHLGDQANAWQQALTLDQLREFIRAERRQLQEQLGRHGTLHARFRRFQERLAELCGKA
jgi:chromosome segregation ATPase